MRNGIFVALPHTIVRRGLGGWPPVDDHLGATAEVEVDYRLLGHLKKILLRFGSCHVVLPSAGTTTRFINPTTRGGPNIFGGAKSFLPVR